ncbi:MAG: UDP-N-acetylmuramoyl-tripeptide--D-alanyl-D-alanine ligase [Candidatus Sericytochromatia bacterium]|nr:UDP-N-acetylmuramoyl-tripeptide--D-alanyl-D-alanine ligase [Candidatus Sericytochromatia bacterium]
MIRPDEIVLATGGRATGPEPATVFDRVVTDSRQSCEGALFLALQGPHFDGHRFLTEALAKGARGAIVSRTEALPEGLPAWTVPDTLLAYGRLARHVRRREGWRVVGITGSSGKTTTKELIADLAARSLGVVRSPENHNNEVGVPRTLLSVPRGTDLVVIEMGMRGSGQIAWLAEIAEPEVGVITTVGTAHIGLLGSQEAIMEAKGELLAGLPGTGHGIVDGDNPWLARLAARHAGTWQTSASGRPDADLRATAQPVADDGTWHLPVAWDLPDGRRGAARLAMPLPGRHHAVNALAAVGTLLALGLEIPEVLDLPGLGVGGRGQVLTAGAIDVVDESYNANPESMRASLETFCTVPAPRRRVAVLGSMAELGEHAVAAWQDLGRWLADAPIDLIVTVGDEPAILAEAAGKRVVRCTTPGEAVRCLQERLGPGDRVLVKGSRAARLDEVVAGLVLHHEEDHGCC